MQILKKIYGDSLKFYRKDFGGTAFAAGWAFAGIVVLSFLASMLFPTQADGIVEQSAQMMQQSGMSDDGGNILFFPLLLNNLVAMITSVSYGLIPFIRLPALTLGVNGASLGLLAGYYVHHDISLLEYLVGILPHGIFEIPALILSAALGLHLCKAVTAALREKKKGAVSTAVTQCGQILVYWILPLTILAAVIETYVTPVLFQAVL